MVRRFFCTIDIAIESWKSLGPQNLATFNYSQTEEDKMCVTLTLPTRIGLCLKKWFFFLPVWKKKHFYTLRFCKVLARPKENAILIDILVSNDF